MSLNVHTIISYVLIGITLIGCVYLFVKDWVVEKKINRLTEFVHWDLFSDHFHHVLSNFFMDETNTKFLIDPLLPVLQQIMMKNFEVPKKSKKEATDKEETPTFLHVSDYVILFI